MRTTDEAATVRLYYLSEGPEMAQAETLLYGTLGEAMALAAQQDAHIQDGLWIATANDVIAWRDLADE